MKTWVTLVPEVQQDLPCQVQIRHQSIRPEHSVDMCIDLSVIGGGNGQPSPNRLGAGRKSHTENIVHINKTILHLSYRVFMRYVFKL
jgi:hypothetical protein